jgi:hypothetical protein
MNHFKTILCVIFLSAPWILSIQLPFLQKAVIAQSKSCTPQNSKEYERYMKLGYQASTQYKSKKIALDRFKRAIKLCPGNIFATTAAKNMEFQLQKGNVVHVTPSGIGAPSNRAQAATRKENCLNGEKVVALIPENELILTATERPTLLFYLPPTPASNIQITLGDGGSKPYTRIVKTPKKQGDFVQFKFSDFTDSPALIPGKTYQWTFTLLCDPQGPSANVTVFGSIQRIELDPILANELEIAKPSDRAILYANNGLWYDTVATLVEALQSNPNDPQLAKSWQELLKSVGL